MKLAPTQYIICRTVMMAKDLANLNQALKSKIISQNFPRRLSSIFGFQTVAKSKAQTEMEANFGIKFVKVDQGNNAYRFKQASLGNIFKSTPLSTPLQKYLEAYMDQTSLSYNDIAERQTRLNELRFAVCNDPFLSAYCTLIADEATQLDEQNRILTVESPSVAFTNKCYELFAQWGITQQRIHSACFDLAQYGEALWSHRVTDKGVERIIPLKVSSLMERLEFSPVHMAEYLAQMYGNLEAIKIKKEKILAMVMRAEAALEKAEFNLDKKKATKQINLGTALNSYCDQRVLFSWCEEYNVPIEKIYTKSQLKSCDWARGTGKDFWRKYPNV